MFQRFVQLGITAHLALKRLVQANIRIKSGKIHAKHALQVSNAPKLKFLNVDSLTIAQVVICSQQSVQLDTTLRRSLQVAILNVLNVLLALPAPVL